MSPVFGPGARVRRPGTVGHPEPPGPYTSNGIGGLLRVRLPDEEFFLNPLLGSDRVWDLRVCVGEGVAR